VGQLLTKFWGGGWLRWLRRLARRPASRLAPDINIGDIDSIGRNQRNHGGQRALLARCRSLTSFELTRENVSSGQSARRISSISSSSAISQSNGWQWPLKPTPVPQSILQSCHPVTKGSPLVSPARADSVGQP
jgi:hypothetical protein